jgi:hypothetical protein
MATGSSARPPPRNAWRKVHVVEDDHAIARSRADALRQLTQSRTGVVHVRAELHEPHVMAADRAEA